jgi:hypothetical protein
MSLVTVGGRAIRSPEMVGGLIIRPLAHESVALRASTVQPIVGPSLGGGGRWATVSATSATTSAAGCRASGRDSCREAFTRDGESLARHHPQDGDNSACR